MPRCNLIPQKDDLIQLFCSNEGFCFANGTWLSPRWPWELAIEWEEWRGVVWMSPIWASLRWSLIWLWAFAQITISEWVVAYNPPNRGVQSLGHRAKVWPHSSLTASSIVPQLNIWNGCLFGELEPECFTRLTINLRFTLDTVLETFNVSLLEPRGTQWSRPKTHRVLIMSRTWHFNIVY